MNIKRIISFTGRIMAVMSLLQLLPLIVCLCYGEKLYTSFIIPAAIFAALGTVGFAFKPKRSRYDSKEGFVITSLSWILISLIGALPFFISREIPSYIDALFETVSGFTTTGSSILTDVEAMSKSLLFWRSFSHWVGGMGVLAFGIALFPVSKGKNNDSASEAHILRAESPGPTYGKFVSKLRHNARILYGIYFALTILEIILLLAGGMPLFDSIVNSVGTAGTGGFSIRNAGIGAYNSAYSEWVISIFMLLFGINFNVYIFMLMKKFKSALKHEEARGYLIIVGVATAFITANILLSGGILNDGTEYQSLWHVLRDAFFQTSSIITTTGYSTVDFNHWPALSKTVLVVLMFFGACAGSTAGGLKISRVIILVKTAFKEIRHSISPRSVRAIRFEGEVVDRSVVTGVCSYFAVYMLLFTLSVIVVAFDNFDMVTTFTSVTTCFNNIGPGLAVVGPVGNFSYLSDFSKIVLSADMLLGRLEIFPLLIAFHPATWKNK